MECMSHIAGFLGKRPRVSIWKLQYALLESRAREVCSLNKTERFSSWPWLIRRTSRTDHDRRVMLAAAFLGWLCAGIEMGLGPLVSRPAARDLLYGPSADVTSSQQEAQIGSWFAWYTAAFLLGGAVGGAVFGRLGDRAGRVRAMGWSIVCFSVFTGAGWFVRTPEQFLILRFLASLGVGGMWPAGVALVSEAWPSASRPLVAGAMGTAANMGILLIALIGRQGGIQPGDWRWVMLVSATPCVLGAAVLVWVPES